MSEERRKLEIDRLMRDLLEQPLVFEWQEEETYWKAIHITDRLITARLTQLPPPISPAGDTQRGSEKGYEIATDGKAIAWIGEMPPQWRLRGGNQLPITSMLGVVPTGGFRDRRKLLFNALIDLVIFGPGIFIMPILVRSFAGEHWQNNALTAIGMLAIVLGTILLKTVQPSFTRYRRLNPRLGAYRFLGLAYSFLLLVFYSITSAHPDAPAFVVSPRGSDPAIMSVVNSVFYVVTLIYVMVIAIRWVPQLDIGTVKHETVQLAGLTLIDFGMLLQYALLKGFRQTCDPSVATLADQMIVFAFGFPCFLVAYATPRFIALRLQGLRQPPWLLLVGLAVMFWRLWILNI